MFFFLSCASRTPIELADKQLTITLSSAKIFIQQDGKMHLEPVTRQLQQPPSSSLVQILDENGKSLPVQFDFRSAKTFSVQDSTGTGKGVQVPGTLGDRAIFDVTFYIYNNFPDAMIARFKFQNRSENPVQIASIQYFNLHLSARDFGSQHDDAFWSFQGASYESRPDWILPLQANFYQENFMGMNAPDYGGGIPVLDLWGPKLGVAIAHLSLSPELVSFPVKVEGEKEVEISLTDKRPVVLQSRNAYRSLPMVLIFHQGDYFNALSVYRQIMKGRGFPFLESFSDWAYEPSWCAWGYERDFKFEEIKNTLPKVKELGFKWVTLDDGWQTANGDWQVRADKYPGGEAGLKAFIKDLHQQGFKVQLWWVPFDAAPNSRLVKDHPAWLLINEKGEYQQISWWDTYYLDPSYEPVVEYTRKLIHKFFAEWDLDGLKIDGQHLNAAPLCYNPAHHHKSPDESYKGTPAFFRMIFEEARRIKPEALIQICPCGDVFSLYHMPYLNQTVASDPLSSWQIRLKGKTYKALMGPSVPYYGDHVELSDGGMDFASQVGIGGIPGSKFTWPFYPRLKNQTYLTPEKEQVFKRWLNIYNRLELSRGQYLNVYDMGWDNPEGHLILKDGIYYYAFYARSPEEGFKGEVELRGLESRHYRVVDYWNDKELGSVQGPEARLPVSFDRFLLLKAIPE